MKRKFSLLVAMGIRFVLFLFTVFLSPFAISPFMQANASNKPNVRQSNNNILGSRNQSDKLKHTNTCD